jgi:tetratricopeptide (TPR) repeat protein
MLRDTQGLEVTTNAPDAIQAINHFVDQSLSYSKDIEQAILQGIVADPTCALAHAYAAAHYLSWESAEGRKWAVPHLKGAHRYQARATEREQLYIRAITAWAEGALEQAIAGHEALVAKFPQDLVAIQQGQYHYFYLGNKEGLLNIAEKAWSVHQDNHYLYGMVAFGLEQCHRWQEAETVGRQAIAMNRHDPWAHHAIAHVMETQGRVEEGIDWMESFADTWENCNSMLYTHNWWHVALYYLAQGNTQEVLELYDTRIWGRAWKESPKDQIGSISLLIRLELSGISVGHRWQGLSTYLPQRIHEHALPFQDVHYIYALARSGQTDLVKEMFLSMEAHAQTVQYSLKQVWTQVAVPTARAMVAYAEGDYRQTIARLKPFFGKLWMLGGSHTQRELFEQIYRDALCRDQYSQQNYSPQRHYPVSSFGQRAISKVS